MTTDSHVTERGVRAVFNRAYAQAEQFPIPAAELVKVVPSTHRLESYAWLNSAPIMRRWVGDKRIAPQPDYRLEVLNADFEATVAIDRNLLDDDQIGAYMANVRTMGQQARWYYGIEGLRVLLKNPVAYDGVPLISGPVAGKRQSSNTLVGSGTDYDELAQDLTRARAMMMSHLADNGEPFGWMGSCVVCHPNLGDKFRSIAGGSLLPISVGTGGAPVSNVSYRSWLRMVVEEPRFGIPNYQGTENAADENDWYLACADFEVGPIIWQNRKEPEFVSNVNRTMRGGGEGMADAEVMRRELLFGAEARGEAAPGIPSMIVKVTNA